MLPSSFNGYGSPSANVRAWQAIGLEVGKPATFTIRLTRPVQDGQSPQLALAVWTRGPQLHSGAVWYPQQVLVGGATYVAVSIAQTDFDGPTASLSAPLSADYDKYWVAGGGRRLDGYGVIAIGSGPAGAVSPDSGAELGGFRSSRGGTVTMRFTAEGGRTVGGLIYLVVYRPADGP